MIEFKGVSKQFGNFFANKALHFRVKKGTIHGLIGENGAGKSTAMKILFGLYQADQGEIWINGKLEKIRNPIQAMNLGLGMVHQHFMLAGNQSVVDNIILGHEPRRFGFGVNRAKAIQALNEISKTYGMHFNKWEEQISNLSVGEQQRVEIIKLLYQKSEVLILDEPTAVLTPQEVQELFQNLKKLKSEGKTIVLISHKLKEVLEFTDEITVMRRGEVVGSIPTQGATEDQLAEMMVGRKVSFTYQGERKIQTATSSDGEWSSLAAVKKLSINKGNYKHALESLIDVSFDVKPGEIVGIGGVQGNGQSELLRFLSHPKKYFQGASRTDYEYSIHQKNMNEATPLMLRSEGVALVPEDRHQEGLFLTQDMKENFLLGQHLDPRFTAGVPALGTMGMRVKRDVLHDSVVQKIKDYDIRPPYPTVWTGRMSGGNQQKLLIARALDPQPSLLIVAHPTRGVDVGAIERIHDVIMKERNQGKAVILFSSELDELMDLSDRILIFYGGKIQDEFTRSEFDPWVLGRVMGGGKKTGGIHASPDTPSGRAP